MRYLIIVLMTSALVGSMIIPATAAGYAAVGRECDCSPLTAQGIVPDTLNRVKLAFSFPWLTAPLDALAVEVRGMLWQFGVGDIPATTVALSEESKDLPKKAPVDVKEKPASGKVSKPDLKKKKLRKITKASKKKKINIPAAHTGP